IFAGGTVNDCEVGESYKLDRADVRAFDGQGNVLWTSEFGSTHTQDFLTGPTADPSGEYVAGAESGRPVIKRFDPNGTEIWTRLPCALTGPTSSDTRATRWPSGFAITTVRSCKPSALVGASSGRDVSAPFRPRHSMWRRGPQRSTSSAERGESSVPSPMSEDS